LASLSAMTEEEFEQFSQALKNSDLKAEAANLFLPAGFHVIAKDVDFSKISEYAETVFRRFSKIGGKIAVFGSGGQRNIPAGLSQSEGEAIFCEVLKVVGAVAAKYNITVVIEPLNRFDCNLVNTVEDAIKICKCVQHKNIAVLADFYHMHRNGEDTDTILNAGEYLKHVHFARRNDDRKLPQNDQDYADCLKFAQNLKKIGYDERISLEANFAPGFAEDIRSVWKYLTLFQS